MDPSFSLPDECLRYQASRSGGPGGQHVNKTSTKITLFFDLDDCDVFDDIQKRKIRRALRSYLNKEGILQIQCRESRSQAANKQAARERLEAMIAAALRPCKKRKKTRPPRSAVEKRLKEKRRTSELKRYRKRTSDD